MKIIKVVLSTSNQKITQTTVKLIMEKAKVNLTTGEKEKTTIMASVKQKEKKTLQNLTNQRYQKRKVKSMEKVMKINQATTTKMKTN